MKDFIKAYTEEFKSTKARETEIEKQIAALEAELNEIKLPNWFVIVEQIAAKLESITGIPCIVRGPHGIRSECRLLLGEDPYEPQCSITITPEIVPGSLAFFYDTGETIEIYPKGTLGAMNGMNNITAPCPDTVEELWEIMKGMQK